MNRLTLCPEYLTFMVEFIALTISNSKSRQITAMDTAMMTMMALYLSTNTTPRIAFLERLEEKGPFVCDGWHVFYMRVTGFNRHRYEQSNADIDGLLERMKK